MRGINIMAALLMLEYGEPFYSIEPLGVDSLFAFNK